MATTEPQTELDARYSAEGATATAWPDARERLAQAELYWVSTVRPDGRPHVTPLIAVWHDGALHFATGPQERKARNLEQNVHCILTTGCNTLHEGLDIVVEGDAVPLRDEDALRRLADAYVVKYGGEWRFEVRDGAFWHDAGGTALVFRVSPVTAYGFGKGEYSHTRWRFDA